MLPGKRRALDIRPELVQQSFGVRQIEAHNVGIAAAPEIEHPAPCLRMGADQGVHRSGRRPWIITRSDALAKIAAAVICPVVLDLEFCDVARKVLRERLVHPVHVAEGGVPASGRHLERIEHAGLRRLLQIGHIRMPYGLACAEAADRHPILDDVRHHVYFGVTLHVAAPGLLDRRPVESPEAPAKGDEVPVIELLPAEKHDGVIKPGAVDGGEVLTSDPPQVDATHFGANRRADWNNFYARTGSSCRQCIVNRHARTILPANPLQTTCRLSASGIRHSSNDQGLAGMVYQFAFTDKPVCRRCAVAAGLESGPLARALDDPALPDEILAAACTA